MTSPIRVLLVDDHAAFRVSLALLLAREADLLAAGRIDVALVDLRLPDGDGVEVVRALREATPRARAVVLTAVFDPAHHARAIAAGAAAILSKSAHPAEILVGVRRAAAGRSVPSGR